MIEIEHIHAGLAEELVRKLTADLPEYFGLPEANEYYAIGVRSRTSLAAKIGDNSGLVSLDFPYANNSNIYFLAVFRNYHGQQVGSKLIEAACSLAIDLEANSMTVETLAPSESDKNYLKTYKFYESCGFTPLFNLRPKDYEWSMVYMVKSLNYINSNRHNIEITIKSLTQADIPLITASFAVVNWPKPQSTFEQYFKEQQKGARLIWLAFAGKEFAGYVTLKWQSQYEQFAKKQIPEIIDLNVLPHYRKFGIGSKLLDTAEAVASSKSSIVGIGVGLYDGYGAAQKLYIKRNYIPYGCVTYNYKDVSYGSSVVLDDDLVLWFIKKLK